MIGVVGKSYKYMFTDKELTSFHGVFFIWLEEVNAKEERIERERPPVGYWIV